MREPNLTIAKESSLLITLISETPWTSLVGYMTSAMNYKVGVVTENMGKPAKTTKPIPRRCGRSSYNTKKVPKIQAESATAIRVIIDL